MAPDTISNFEREFGVRVRYATYESNEEMLAKVLTGNSGWDVVFPTHNRLLPMREYGLLAPLRHELLPNLRQSGRRDFRTPAWDPASIGACLTCGTAPASPTTAASRRRRAAWADLVGASG